ncbi:MAG: hypothetical protein SGJ19_05150 [Planctomycetia bacterium]|nr:hypothetical protein [Planctomycetia bacterium]
MGCFRRVERLTLQQAAEREGVNRATIFRWWKVGVGGIRLVTRRHGGKRVVDPRALEEFHAAVNARDQIAPSTLDVATAPAPQRAMRQRLAAADREFKARIGEGRKGA